MTQHQPTVLQRKAGAGRPAPDHGVVTAATALRLAVSKAGQDVLRTRLDAGEVGESRLTLGAMAAELPARGLHVLLRGSGGAAGLVALDASLLTAVLQAQTAGRVTDAPVAERAPTQTDAILARRFLAVLLDSFGARLAGRPAAIWAAGFQPRERVADAARLPHLLADTAYRALETEVDIAGGLRRGRLLVILPRAGAEEATLPPAPGEGAPPDTTRTAWREALAGRVLDSPAALEAVLCRIEIPLSEIAGLAPDRVLPIPARALGEVALEAVDGRVAATGRLGQTKGSRAVKILRAGSAAAQPAAADSEDEPQSAGGALALAVPSAGHDPGGRRDQPSRTEASGDDEGPADTPA